MIMILSLAASIFMRQRSKFTNRQWPDRRADPQMANRLFCATIIIMNYFLNGQRAHAALATAHACAAIAFQLIGTRYTQLDGRDNISLCQGLAATDNRFSILWNTPFIRWSEKMIEERSDRRLPPFEDTPDRRHEQLVSFGVSDNPPRRQPAGQGRRRRARNPHAITGDKNSLN